MQSSRKSYFTCFDVIFFHRKFLISYKFVQELYINRFTLGCQILFGDNFFYNLLFLSETFRMCANVFYIVRNEFSA